MDDRMQRRVALARDVLALGAMMVACCDDAPRNAGCHHERVIECLVPLFSVEELALIEATFEADSTMPMASACGSGLGDDLDEASCIYTVDPDDPDPPRVSAADRLRAIMTSIIANNGVFEPGSL